MITKKKKRKDPQRLKHKVRFNIEFDYKPKDSHKSKPLIVYVQAGSRSENKFFIGDLIKSVNNIQVKTGDDFVPVFLKYHIIPVLEPTNTS